ncbi:MAG: fibronectin type III domain-containing protein, partial [Candidatus Wallbacteria bacterium]|nr:fibronectin type III domain-containing protein [Candidatus Wallbacteria bacterium]
MSKYFRLALAFLIMVLSVSTSHSGIIPLKQGWNLISLGVKPPSESIEVIFSSVPDMKYVMGFFRLPADEGTEGFRTYVNIENMRDFSTLKTMDGYHGYWVYMTADANLEVQGTAVSTTQTWTMAYGWNLIGYWLVDNNQLPTALDQTGTVVDFLLHPESGGTAKYIIGFYRSPADEGNEGFRTFMFNSAIDFSTLSNLDPFHGYWIYMQNQGILEYSVDSRVLNSLSILPSSLTMNTGATYNLSNITVTAAYTDGTSNTSYKPTWSKKSGDGTVSGSTYTALSTSGSAILTASLTRNGITKTADLSVTFTLAAPIPPTGLSASNRSDTSFTLSWSSVSEATSYNVYKDGTLYDTATTNSKNITGLSAETVYTMEVSAVNSSGESAKSLALIVTTNPSLVIPTLSSITLSPNTINLTTGGTYELSGITATAHYSDSTAAAVTGGTWSKASGDGSVSGHIYTALDTT